MTFHGIRRVMKKAIFIAHGGKNIGMGHVIRCMSLANAFRLKNYSVKFISKYETGQRALYDHDFEVLPYSDLEEVGEGFHYGTKKELEKDLEFIHNILDEENADVLVVDSYNVTNQFLQAVAKKVRCSIYIDDIAAFPYPVDIVLNGNISAYWLDYKTGYQNQKLLLGLEYNLIRQEYREVPKREMFDNCNSIMITTGASDPYQMTEKIIQILLKYDWLKEYAIHVVIGNGFRDDSKNKINVLALNNSNIIVHENPVKMSSIMMQCDLAITAGGSTLYELFACGVITFSFIYAENQRSTVETSAKKGYLFPIGDYQKINEEEIINKIKLFSENVQMRKELVNRLQKLLDCKGTERIVRKVEEFLIEKQEL